MIKKNGKAGVDLGRWQNWKYFSKDELTRKTWNFAKSFESILTILMDSKNENAQLDLLFFQVRGRFSLNAFGLYKMTVKKKKYSKWS